MFISLIKYDVRKYEYCYTHRFINNNTLYYKAENNLYLNKIIINTLFKFKIRRKDSLYHKMRPNDVRSTFPQYALTQKALLQHRSAGQPVCQYSRHGQRIIHDIIGTKAAVTSYKLPEHRASANDRSNSTSAFDSKPA